MSKLLVIILIISIMLLSLPACNKADLSLAVNPSTSATPNPAGTTAAASSPTTTPSATTMTVTPLPSTTTPTPAGTIPPATSVSPAVSVTATTTSVPTTTSPPPPPAPLAPLGVVLVEQTISAATGGTIVSGDGRISLDIPAGALEADTSIQVRQVSYSEIPEPLSVFPVGPMYDFQPNGLTFSQPAAVTFRLSAADFIGLSLAPSTSPIVVPLSCDDQGNWETLQDITIKIDYQTGDYVVSAAMRHFSTTNLFPFPVEVSVDPPQLELTAGQGWNTSVIVTNTHNEWPLFVQGVDFFANGRDVTDGDSDVTVPYPIQPGQSVTVTQEGRSRMSGAGEGQFGANISIGFPGPGDTDANGGQGVQAVRGWINTDQWAIPPSGPPGTLELVTTLDPNLNETITPNNSGLPSPTNTVEVTPSDDSPEASGEVPSQTTPAQTLRQWDFWDTLFDITSGQPAGLSFMEISIVCMMRALVDPGAIVPAPAPCFAGDTLVLMADGSTKRIMDIQPKERVLSYDETAAQSVVGTVAATGGGQASYYYLINGNIKVTPPHPFYSIDRGWVKVEELTVGDVILAPEGTTVVTSIKLVEESQDIFNISVADFGCYFVSADGTEFFLVKEGL